MIFAGAATRALVSAAGAASRRGLASVGVTWRRCAVSGVDLTSVGGAAGVVTSGAGSIATGDHVVAASGSAAWAADASVDAASLLVVPKEMPMEQAATLGFAAAALAVLDGAALSPGDLVVQSGPMGAFAEAVVEICASRGVKTVTVLDAAPNYAEAHRWLSEKGADVVAATAYADSFEWRRLLADFPPAKLAINGSGGAPATALARALGPGGAMVTTDRGGAVAACCTTYGSQGKRQAAELKKAGLPVVVALRPSSGSWEAAAKDGFVEGESLLPLAQAKAAITLVPPEVASAIELRCASVAAGLDCNSLDAVLGLGLEPPHSADLKPFSALNHAMTKARDGAGTVVVVMDE